jgi:uncharacterized membrane protein
MIQSRFRDYPPSASSPAALVDGPAVVSWAAYLGWFNVQDTWAAFWPYGESTFYCAALVELVNDSSKDAEGRLLHRSQSDCPGAACGAALRGVPIRSSAVLWIGRGGCTLGG